MENGQAPRPKIGSIAGEAVEGTVGEADQRGMGDAGDEGVAHIVQVLQDHRIVANQADRIFQPRHHQHGLFLRIPGAAGNFLQQSIVQKCEVVIWKVKHLELRVLTAGMVAEVVDQVIAIVGEVDRDKAQGESICHKIHKGHQLLKRFLVERQERIRRGGEFSRLEGDWHGRRLV